ncbi:hypothetical protein PO124_06420 [Bacillus licheniformis]|nr:hypothetical protein [Bacillus licheniformis]
MAADALKEKRKSLGLISKLKRTVQAVLKWSDGPGNRRCRCDHCRRRQAG